MLTQSNHHSSTQDRLQYIIMRLVGKVEWLKKKVDNNWWKIKNTNVENLVNRVYTVLSLKCCSNGGIIWAGGVWNGLG